MRRGLRAAVQTYYTVVFYNTVTRVLKWLGAGSFFEWVTPRLERAYARLSGAADVGHHTFLLASMIIALLASSGCSIPESGGGRQSSFHPLHDAAGVWYELPNGRREPFSLANNYDPGFSPPPPYDPRVRGSRVSCGS